MSNNIFSRLVIILLACPLAACGSQNNEAGKSSTTSQSSIEDHQIDRARQQSQRWVRGGAWKIVGHDGNPPQVAIALSKEDARLLVPAGERGYDIHRVQIRCGKGDYVNQDGMRSASDGMAPTVPLKGYPPTDLRDAIARFCSGEGTLVRGEVAQAMQRIRADAPQGDAMGMPGLKGIKR